VNLPNNRAISLGVAVACGALIAIAIFYFQNHLGLEPCYLCITQRVFVIAVGVIFLVSGLHNPAATGQKIYAALAATAAFGGSFFSIKQLWLQVYQKIRCPPVGPQWTTCSMRFQPRRPSVCCSVVTATVQKCSGSCWVSACPAGSW